jgi:hypothetical protein
MNRFTDEREAKEAEDPEPGSTSLKWWRRRELNPRTSGARRNVFNRLCMASYPGVRVLSESPERNSVTVVSAFSPARYSR